MRKSITFQKPKNNFKYFYIKGFKIGVMICWDQWHMNSYAFMKKIMST